MIRYRPVGAGAFVTAISALQLYNFRSHQRCVFRLDKRHVILSGRNGSGKTSILEAISLCSPGRGLRYSRMPELSRYPGHEGWRVIVDLDGSDQVSINTWCSPGATSRQIRINDNPARQLELSDQIRVLWLTPVMDRLWSESSDKRRRFLDRMTMSMYPQHPVVVSNYEKALRERNRLLRDGIIDDHWLDSLELQMAENGSALTSNRMKAIRKIEEAFQSTTTSFPSARITIVQDHKMSKGAEDPHELVALFRSGRRADAAAGRTLAGPHRADMAVLHGETGRAAGQCSTGEQKALLIAIVVANTRAVNRMTGSIPILLLDEAAAHLDLELRKVFMDEICSIEGQVWLTCTEIGELMVGRHDVQHLCLDSTNDHNVNLNYVTSGSPRSC